MEQTLELQKEFESLVKNLERLKRISDITETNAESTNMLISEIEEFVKSNEKYNTKLKKNLDDTYNSLHNTSTEIQAYLTDFSKNHDKFRKEYAQIIENSKGEFNKEMTAHIGHAAVYFKEELDKFQKISEKIPEVINENLIQKIGLLRAEMGSINSSQASLKLQIENVTKGLELNTRGIIEKTDQLQEELADLNERVDDNGLKSTVILYAVVLVIILQIVNFFI